MFSEKQTLLRKPGVHLLFLILFIIGTAMLRSNVLRNSYLAWAVFIICIILLVWLCLIRCHIKAGPEGIQIQVSGMPWVNQEISWEGISYILAFTNSAGKLLSPQGIQIRDEDRTLSFEGKNQVIIITHRGTKLCFTVRELWSLISYVRSDHPEIKLYVNSTLTESKNEQPESNADIEIDNTKI